MDSAVSIYVRNARAPSSIGVEVAISSAAATRYIQGLKDQRVPWTLTLKKDSEKL